ncbi:MAG: radical SAM protein [Verrucomicrobiales bacterium]|nr:radical SAM protein [Verrucomicrobiales bacterium]
MSGLRLLSLPLTVLRNRQGGVPRPRFLTYIVTFTCNARCVMCDSWKKPSPDDLSLEEIERIFRQLPPLDFVRLSGGEPFVRSDLPEIAGLAERHLRPLCLHITSNGFLTDRIVRFCENRPKQTPLRLLISIDGMAPQHNAIRGRDTAWDSAVATLRALSGRRRELNLILSVNQTITDAASMADYARLRDFLQPLGIRNNVVMAYRESATYSVDASVDTTPRHPGAFQPYGVFSPGEIEAFLGQVEADLGTAAWADRAAKRYYLRGIRNRLLEGRSHPNPPCVALHSHLRLMPNGDVPVCQFNSRSVGNLRRQSFAEVWKGIHAASQRRWVRACPGCWAECEILPSALYTGDILREALVLGSGDSLPVSVPGTVRAPAGTPVAPAAPARGQGALTGRR